MKYRALIFDFFGVLGTDITSSWFTSRFPEPETQNIKKEFFYDADVGKITEKELFNKLSGVIETTPDNIERQIYDSVVLNQELFQLITELKKKYKIGLCTNSVLLYVRKLLKENNLENLFDSIIVSSEVGLVKPDPKIYIKTLESMGITADEAVFIDDTLENVQEAEKIGMKGLWFKSNDEFKAQLLQLE